MAANPPIPGTFESVMAYTTWADDKIVQVARLLTAEQFAAIPPAGMRSVHFTLAHMLAAQQGWLLRWQGTSPTRIGDDTDFPTLDSIVTAWETTHRDLEAFVAAGIDPQAMLTYKSTRGIEYTEPMGMLVLHVVNHSTQHRSEIAAMCSAVGHSPGDMDITVYLRQTYPKV